MVSCSSNEDPIEDDNKERTLSYYAGTWVYPSNHQIYYTIDLDGSITHKRNPHTHDKDETIPATSIKRINDTNFTYPFKNPYKYNGATNAEIYFYNDKEGWIAWYHGNTHNVYNYRSTPIHKK